MNISVKRKTSELKFHKRDATTPRQQNSQYSLFAWIYQEFKHFWHYRF